MNQGSLPEFVPVVDLYDFYKRMLDVNLRNVAGGNLQDVIVLLQIKLVSPEYKTLNTFSFVNLPQAQCLDPNFKLFAEVMSKTKTEFLPYNKSILTRILYPEMKK